MPRLKKTDYLMYFDDNRFEAELKKALRKATRKIRDLLVATIKRNLSGIQFKDNPVVVGGVETSDAERKESLLRSIDIGGHVRTHIVNFTKYYTGIAMDVTVSVMKDNFKDSHVGWYYEIGTGEESDEALYRKYGMTASLGDKNPYRLPHVGAPIVSRSRKEGSWRDLGGNIRTTGSNIGGIGNVNPPKAGDGEPIPQKRYRELVKKFYDYIGPDIKAYKWFERAVEEVSDQVLDIYKEAIMSVDIFDPKLKIFHLRDKIVIK